MTPAKEATVSSFEDFGFIDTILQGIREAGFETPSPVQSLAIPVLLEGRDATVMAATGTGKTAAYGLPSLDYLARHPDETMLVMAPTRELAAQISDELYRLGKYANLRTVAIYGGRSYGRQTDIIKRGVHIIVATPGRLLDLLDSGRLKFSPSIVVLDEADEMLDMGFIDDIQRIMEYVPGRMQTLLFSATLPPPIQALIKKFQKNPVMLKAAGSSSHKIEQSFYVVDEDERDLAAVRLIESMQPEKCILFCRTREETDRLTSMLLSRSFPAASLHGDIDQSRREKTIRDFRQGRVKILVATDVAARGLDVADVSHVFNYHIPGNAESYVHRIGRTGRAGRSGQAITFVSPGEIRRLRILKQVAGNIRPAMIPTLQELRRREAERMAGLIQEAEFTEDAVRQIKRLMQSGLTAEEIAARAFSLLIEKDVPDGPETIGWDLDRINDFLYRPSPRSSGGFPSHRVSRGNRKSAQSRRRDYGRGRSRSG
jgi:ATP-dependent RNA helicase DeaD